jgi:putative membrane protein
MVFSLKERGVRTFFVIFYGIGVVGLLLPLTSPFFMKLIPYTLLLNFVLLVYFHVGKIDIWTIAVFSIILLTGLAIEIIGVNTGAIFGDYKYGPSLGLKVHEAPVIIGLNWMLLIYLTASVLEGINVSVYAKILLASALMVVYDLVLEQVAPRLAMWTWEGNSVPLQNYISWFVMALIFHSIIRLFGVKTHNPLSVAVLVSQFIFFVLLFFFLP